MYPSSNQYQQAYGGYQQGYGKGYGKGTFLFYKIYKIPSISCIIWLILL